MRGVVVTVTTDPKRFESIAVATETLMDDVNNLKSWIASRFSDGTSPANVVASEFTDTGLPHAHIALFGMGFVPEAALSHYWNTRRDRAYKVYCDGIVHRGGRWVWWSGRPGRSGGRGPRAYLSKAFAEMESLAAAHPDTVHAAAESLRADTGESDARTSWWKLALYWIMDTRCSRHQVRFGTAPMGAEPRKTARCSGGLLVWLDMAISQHTLRRTRF